MVTGAPLFAQTVTEVSSRCNPMICNPELPWPQSGQAAAGQTAQHRVAVVEHREQGIKRSFADQPGRVAAISPNPQSTAPTGAGIAHKIEQMPGKCAVDVGPGGDNRATVSTMPCELAAESEQASKTIGATDRPQVRVRGWPPDRRPVPAPRQFGSARPAGVHRAAKLQIAQHLAVVKVQIHQGVNVKPLGQFF